MGRRFPHYMYNYDSKMEAAPEEVMVWLQVAAEMSPELVHGSQHRPMLGIVSKPGAQSGQLGSGSPAPR